MPGHPLFLAKYMSLMNSQLLFRKPDDSFKLSFTPRPFAAIAFSFSGLLSFVIQKSFAFGKLTCALYHRSLPHLLTPSGLTVEVVLLVQKRVLLDVADACFYRAH
jgi:hypothetical protein